MIIDSPAFESNQMIPSKYTCDGENINPPLAISGVSESAKSLVLIFDDPDSPSGTWTHWTLFNIDPKTTIIEENSVPKNTTEGLNTFGNIGYGGPCPQKGMHRYFFKLYALDTMLNLDSSATKENIESAMQGHILQETNMMGTYIRSK